MEKLRKLRVSSYARNGRQVNDVCAYSGEEEELSGFQTAQQDSSVSYEEYVANQKLHQIHEEQTNNVGMATVAGTLGGGTKGGILGFATSVYTQCWNSCHNQSPPKKP